MLCYTSLALFANIIYCYNAILGENVRLVYHDINISVFQGYQCLPIEQKATFNVFAG